MKTLKLNKPAVVAVLALHCACVPLRASLERDFQSPPPETRPWVYWYFMDGNLTREGLTADLQAMKEAGIGGAIFLEVDLGLPRGPVQFMSPEWRRLFAHAVHEAERRGIEIVLGSGPGWCGTGGPWVKPEQAMQHLVASETNVVGPVRLDAVLPRPQPRAPFFGVGTLTPETKRQWEEFYHDVAVLAFPTPVGEQRLPDADEKALYFRAPYSSQPGVKSSLPAPAEHPVVPPEECVARERIVELTARLEAGGRLTWDVPPGRWTILRLGRTLTGQITRPAPAPGLGFETDKFDAAALDAHLDHYVESLIREIGPRPRKGPGGLSTLHFDSWEMSAQNWSAQFREEFRRRRGYDPLPFLPAFTGRIVDSVEITERFLWDVRQTAQELVITNHVARLKARAHKHGLRYSNEPYDMNPCADLSLGAVADVPMGEFWWHGFDTTYSVIEAASLAHTGGKRIVAAEAFTSAPGEDWRGYPGNLKALGDWALAAGINRIAFHRYQHQPWLDRWPGMRMGPYGVHWERTQTWWPMAGAYHQYLARCQLLLRQGEAVADILFLAAEGAPHVFRAPPSATLGSPPDRRGYNFDGCAPDTLLARATVKDGKIVFPGGTSYRLLVLPETGTMTPQLLRKVRELVRAGATVVGAPPRKSPSLSNFPRCDAEARALAAEIWEAAGDGRKGRVLWGPQFAKETVRRADAPHPLEGAHWIWADTGEPGINYPPGTVHFRRDVALPAGAAIESASVWVTADNSFQLTVNGRAIGRGNNFTRVNHFDLTTALQPGVNTLAVNVVNAGDAPNPAGLVATVEVLLREGQRLRWHTDRTWLAGPSAPEANRPARELGAFGMPPWHRPQLVEAAQHVEPLYPGYAALADLLHSLGVPPDFETDAPIRYTHRRAGATDIYFVANRTDRPVEATCVFRVAGKQPELWHPVTGERRALPRFAFQQPPLHPALSPRGGEGGLRPGEGDAVHGPDARSQFEVKAFQEGRTSVPLRFAPHESFFIVFRKTARADRSDAPNFVEPQPLQTLGGPWQVQFGNPWTEPLTATFAQLEDWTQRPEPQIKYYSGIATYRKTFTVAGEAEKTVRGARTFLDLGVVQHLARVRLNGRDLGVVWCAPWRVETTGALRPGANDLEIEVANLWINRLIGDAALPESQRRTWTSHNPYTKDSPLVSSGLLGPVTLQVRPLAP